MKKWPHLLYLLCTWGVFRVTFVMFVTKNIGANTVYLASISSCISTTGLFPGATCIEMEGVGKDCKRKGFKGGTRKSVCIHMARMTAALTASLYIGLLIKSQFSVRSRESFHGITWNMKYLLYPIYTASHLQHTCTNILQTGDHN